ncbi:putative spore germination protein GerPF [Pullulanibacillus camelliae]|uniref:Putative spore germination protein GerPF n=1 Tax=Pullulanibacillus camelliae TaxID=1707096 RepID=A0A8J2VV58_9BACL|nr:spore germination protein [Pullulanibacillus camelliae]GGE39164.1 putative spore germination protein GerPF [Pullulanibacillus camelliae]
MPGITGPIKIDAIASGGVFNVGDTLNVAPKTTNKNYSGAGAANTGDFIQTNNIVSNTNSLDNDILDSSNAANN